MKRFMQFSIGVLCLSIAGLIGFDVGHDVAWAGYVDHSTSGIIAFNEVAALDENGRMWNVSATGWVDAGTYPLPVPVEQIKFIHYTRIITTSNVAWSYYDGQWHNIGAWPDSPVPTAPSTLGGVKSKYK